MSLCFAWRSVRTTIMTFRGELLAFLLVINVLFISAQEADINGHVFKVSTARGKIPINELSKQNDVRRLEEEIFGPTTEVQDQIFERVQIYEKSTNNIKRCGGVFDKKQSVIYSPNYPKPYPKNVECNYIFKNVHGKNCQYNFQFLDFELENSVGCRKDRLEILDSEPICGGKIGIASYHTDTNTLHVRFTSDGDVESKGFRILVSQLPCLEDADAVITLEESSTNDPAVTRRSIPDSKVDSVNTEVSFVNPVSTDADIKPDLPLNPEVKPSVNVNTKGQPQFDKVPPHPIPLPHYPNPNNPPFPIPPYPTFPSVPQFPFPPPAPVYPPTIHPALPDCCRNNFDDRQFLLSSPGFPQSNIHRGDCQYRITRASPYTCRLRIRFRYFWSGAYDQRSGCTRGFLEVGGKRICGCRSGLVHDVQWGNGPIILRFRNEGFPDLFYSGFVLEITQLECPRRYLKDDIKINSVSKTDTAGQLNEFDDTANRVTWPKKRSVDLLAQNVSFDFDDSDFGLPSFDPKPVKINNNNTQNSITHTTNTTKVKRSANDKMEVYFFEFPWTDDGTETLAKGETEEVTSKFLHPMGVDNGFCHLWGLKQWIALSAESLWQQRPLCIPPNKICQIHNSNIGEICLSHYNNPINLDVCYRFIYKPGSNRIRLQFNEFYVEPSPNCSRHKLLIGNQAYCGNALHGITIDIIAVGGIYPDIKFVTDSFNSQTKFRIWYTYI